MVGHPVCGRLKFTSEVIYLNLFELIFTWYTAAFHCFVILKFSVVSKSCTIKVALHIRWFTNENIQNYETVKGGCIPSNN